MNITRQIAKLVLIVILTCSLAGCFGAVYTGATTVYNSYNVEKDWHNRWVNIAAINILNQQKDITQNGNIAVDTVNFVVLLTGHVDSPQIRDKAINLVKQIKGVKRVVDGIVVGPSESTGDDIKDSWITTKIKAKYILNDNIDASAIKVVTTRDGIVFLMGVVPAPMAKLAAKLAGTTHGVTKVITLFEILTIKN